MAKYYRLAKDVRVEGSVLLLGDVELFEMDCDAAKLMNCIDVLSRSRWFDLREIARYLGLENSERNLLAIYNTLDYLKRCFVLDEEERH